MSTTPRARRGRSLAGLAIGIVLAPVLIGIAACLKVPIGDPERGWADPRVSGVWLASWPQPADYQAWIWVFEPYDSRTWLLTWLQFSPEDDENGAAAEEPADAREAAGPPAGEVATAPPDTAAMLRIAGTLADPEAGRGGFCMFKAWLTSIGDRRFLVLEPKLALHDELDFAPEFWFVYHIVARGDRLQLAGVDSHSFGLDAVTTRGQAEQIILCHLAEPDLYKEPVSFHRMPRAAYSDIIEAAERSTLSCEM
jgi:hypothetical protein